MSRSREAQAAQRLAAGDERATPAPSAKVLCTRLLVSCTPHPGLGMDFSQVCAQDLDQILFISLKIATLRIYMLKYHNYKKRVPETVGNQP